MNYLAVAAVRVKGRWSSRGMASVGKKELKINEVKKDIDRRRYAYSVDISRNVG